MVSQNSSIDANVELHFQEMGIGTSFPADKIMNSLASEPSSKSRLESELKEFPNGIRDQRGEEQLFPAAKIHTGQEELDVFFIGNSHIPYFHQKLRESGGKPYIISSYHSQNPNPSSLDDVNGMMSIVRALTRYPLEIAQQGKPTILIGDTHGQSYSCPFPEPQKLKKLGITKMYIQAEGVPKYGTEADKRKGLEHGFKGKRNLFDYMQKVEAAGIKVEVIGLEPPRDRDLTTRGLIKPETYLMNLPKINFPGYDLGKDKPKLSE